MTFLVKYVPAKCPRCDGTDFWWRECDGVGQCRSCWAVFELPEGRWKTVVKRTEPSRDEANAEYFGLSLRRYRGRMANGQMPGTVSVNGQEALRGSLSGIRRVYLPVPADKGSVCALKQTGTGSVGIRNIRVDCRHPWVQLQALAPESQPYELLVIRQGAASPNISR